MAKARSRSTIFVLGFRLPTFTAFLLDSLFSSTSSSSVSSRSFSPLSTASSLNHLEAEMVFGGGGGRMRVAGLRRPLRMSSFMASAVSSAHWTFVAMTPEAPRFAQPQT